MLFLDTLLKFFKRKTRKEIFEKKVYESYKTEAILMNRNYILYNDFLKKLRETFGSLYKHYNTIGKKNVHIIASIDKNYDFFIEIKNGDLSVNVWQNSMSKAFIETQKEK